MPRLLALVLLAACSSDSEATRCKPDGEGDSPGIGLPVGSRNPETGECSGPIVGGCDEEPGGDGPADVPSQHWPSCDTVCEPASEAECLVLDGCRAIYSEGEPRVFFACWGTNTNGPIMGVGCATDEAEECARRHDCIGVHDSSGMFLSCDVEPKSTLGECTFARCTPAE
jgi:hypothetical protein